jgi:effector-binding domain-containing protein
MIDPPTITQSVAAKTATIRIKVPWNELPAVMGPGFGELMGAISSQGIAPTGPPFCFHHGIDPAGADFEISVPVEAPVTPVGRVEPSDLPSRKIARTVYRGPYEGLADAWQQFDEWIRSNGHSPDSVLWECYAKGPEASPHPADWQTELNRPLAE